MDWNWEYECLAENAEYSEVEWQCVYEIEDILWNTTTIMSSNLWATETNPMWDFYQWWSNYKYPRYPYNALNNWDCNLDENGNWDCPLDGYEYYLEEDENWEEEHTDYYINEHYPSYGWYEYDWPEWVQWPCPSWYHVPTANEWANILIKWCEDDEICDSRDLEYGNNWSNISHWYLGYPLRDWTQSWDPDLEVMVNRFASKYNLSFAGLRNNNTIFYVGSRGGYWSSSDYWSYEDVNFGIEPANWIGMRSSGRRGGLSVRCINDSYSAPSILALDLYRWWCEESYGIWPFLSLSSLCDDERLGRKFIAAYDGVIDTDKLTEIAAQYGNLPIPGEWKQWVWYLVNEQDETQKITPNTRLSDNAMAYVFEEDIPMHTVTFNSNGWSIVNSMDIEEWKSIQILPTSKKDWYTLEWWYLDEWFTARYTNQPITDAITLYAKWTENKWNGYSGWWGSSSKPTSSLDKKDDKKDTDTKKTEPETNNDAWKNIKIITNAPVNTEKETFNAHQWAYSKWLTKYRTSSEARISLWRNKSDKHQIPYPQARGSLPRMQQHSAAGFPAQQDRDAGGSGVPPERHFVFLHHEPGKGKGHPGMRHRNGCDSLRVRKWCRRRSVPQRMRGLPLQLRTGAGPERVFKSCELRVRLHKQAADAHRRRRQRAPVHTWAFGYSRRRRHTPWWELQGHLHIRHAP